MKIFKAFNLLHRRTKSDIFVSGSSLQSATTDSEPPSRRYSVPVSLFDLVTSQIPANFNHFNDRGSGGGASVALPVFGSENGLNARLMEANSRWTKECAKLQCHLQECREELLIEKQKVQSLQHKLEEDNRIILDLRMSSRRFERLLGVSNHAAINSPQYAYETGMLLNATMPNISNDSFANVTNLRTVDEYSSALRMTLATRKELRDQKKVSTFWKRKALDSNQVQSDITPSVSTISSIRDPLPLGRQIALDALISRRRLDSTLETQIEWRDASYGPSKILTSKSPVQHSADEVGSTITLSRPAMSSEKSFSSRLEPLASESIKAEISSLFGSPDSVKYLVPRKRPHSSSFIGRLTKFTFATSTPAKKTDSTLNVESFGDLRTIFATTFGVDKPPEEDESNNTQDEIDMEDDLITSLTSALPPGISVPVPSGPPTRSVLQMSNIPIRRVVPSAGTHNEYTANWLKQASKDCSSRRSYKARPATNVKVRTILEGNDSPKDAPGPHNLPARDKENSFARTIPLFKRKNITQHDTA